MMLICDKCRKVKLEENNVRQSFGVEYLAIGECRICHGKNKYLRCYILLGDE